MNGNLAQCRPYSRNVTNYHSRDACLIKGKFRQTLDVNLLICETIQYHKSLALSPGTDTAPW